MRDVHKYFDDYKTMANQGVVYGEVELFMVTKLKIATKEF